MLAGGVGQEYVEELLVELVVLVGRESIAAGFHPPVALDDLFEFGDDLVNEFVLNIDHSLPGRVAELCAQVVERC